MDPRTYWRSMLNSPPHNQPASRKRHARVSLRSEHMDWMASCRQVRKRSDDAVHGGGGLRPDLKRDTLVQWLRDAGLEVVDASQLSAHERMAQPASEYPF